MFWHDGIRLNPESKKYNTKWRDDFRKIYPKKLYEKVE